MAELHVLKRKLGVNEMFISFAVNGREVEVSWYENSDLLTSRDMARERARWLYREALKAGYKKDEGPETVGGVEVMYRDRVTGVAVINVCRLLDRLFGSDRYDRPRVSYEEESEAIRNWLHVTGAHYYAAPREDFNEYTAVRQAQEAGKTAVVVEDMS
jgi:hypothetical protein